MSPKEAMEAVQAAAKVGWSEVEAWVGWKVERWTNGIKWSHLSEFALCHGSFLQDENTKLCQISLKYNSKVLSKSVKFCQISHFFRFKLLMTKFRQQSTVAARPGIWAVETGPERRWRSASPWPECLGTYNKRIQTTYLTYEWHMTHMTFPHTTTNSTWQRFIRRFFLKQSQKDWVSIRWKWSLHGSGASMVSLSKQDFIKRYERIRRKEVAAESLVVYSGLVRVV